MNRGVSLVLMPGMDGTARLFDRFVRAAPAGVSVTSIAFPPDRVLSYAELFDLVCAALPAGRLVLLGESFSGPLALRLAARLQPAATILCASFVRAAAPLRLAGTSLSFLLRARPAKPVVRLLLSGGDEALASDVVAAVGTVAGSVMASRLRMILEVDATSDLAAFRGALLYLRAKRDRLVPAHQAALVRERRPDAAVEVVDGPHLLLQARPAECWNRIASFLAPLVSV